MVLAWAFPTGLSALVLLQSKSRVATSTPHPRAEQLPSRRPAGGRVKGLATCLSANEGFPWSSANATSRNNSDGLRHTVVRPARLPPGEGCPALAVPVLKVLVLSRQTLCDGTERAERIMSNLWPYTLNLISSHPSSTSDLS